MLILTREPGEEIEIIAQGSAVIKLVIMDAYSNGVVKLGFDAPQHVQILRDNALKRDSRRRSNRKEQGDGSEEVLSKPDVDSVGNR